MSIQESMKGNSEKRQLTFEEFLSAIMGDIDPAKYAGEGWYATEEYARPADIDNPWTRGEVGKEGEYYPPADWKRMMKDY